MAKHFNPGDVASVKTSIAFAPALKPSVEIDFLVRRVARKQRRLRRAL